MTDEGNKANEAATAYTDLAKRIMAEETSKLIEESRDTLIERTRKRLNDMAQKAQDYYEDKTL